MVGELDTVVTRVALHHRPAARAVARLVGAELRPVGEDVAGKSARAVGAARCPGEGRAVGAAGPRREPGQWEKTTAVERVVVRRGEACLDDIKIEGAWPRQGARRGQS